jgi:hypothetical protein
MESIDSDAAEAGRDAALDSPGMLSAGGRP